MPDPTPTPESAAKPTLIRVIGPAGAGKTYLITLLIEELRPLGHFVATSAPRQAFNQDTTVITTSSGARVTVEKQLSPEALRNLVASLDPRASLLLAESLDAPGIPAIEVGDEHAIKTPDLLASVRTSELAPGALAPLAQLLDRHLRGAPEPRPNLLSRLLRGRKGSSE